MITNFKGGYPTDEEIWEALPQEVREKILQGYVDAFREAEKKKKKGGAS